MTLSARFWAKVDVSAGPEACWLWTGRAHPKNLYGRIRVDGKTTYAHRASWAIHFGPIPAGLLVCHSCDVPTCVNPAHLWLGTDADNQRDMWAKGRGVGASKLTLEALRAIARLRSRGWHTVALAVRFGVSRRTVYRAIAGTTLIAAQRAVERAA